MRSIDRILDANGNRAREAARVAEEAARMILDDAELAHAWKDLRHGVARSVAALAPSLAARDTPADVGTTITTDTERDRASVRDVVTAACKRLTEALRVLEEYGKTIDPAVAADIEAMRYAAYSLEQHTVLKLGAGRPATWRLCLLVTESMCAPRDWLDVTAAAMDGGADCIQLREKDLDDRDLLDRARRLVALRRPGTAIIINDRPDVALAANADGVHLGQHDLEPAAVRRLAGDQLIIGVSTSKLAQARAARTAGADYCGVGPMFATTTTHKPRLAGPEYLRAYVEWNGLPHLAIGGITEANVDELVTAGCHGIAVSAAICGAKDPRAAAAALRTRLDAGVGVDPALQGP